MSKNNPLLYTLRAWYRNKKNTGIIITGSAMDGKGDWHSIKLYVPFRSRYEESATAEVLNAINNLPEMARINLKMPEKKFNEENEEF